MGEELMSKYKSLFFSGLLYAFVLHGCKFLVTDYLMLAKQFAGGNIQLLPFAILKYFANGKRVPHLILPCQKLEWLFLGKKTLSSIFANLFCWSNRVT